MKVQGYRLTLLSFVAMGIMASCQSAPREGQLNAQGYQSAMNEKQNEVLIDVRTPEEYSEGHLQGSVNINWNDASFMEQAGKLDKTKPVFVYCRSGHRSGQAAEALRSKGFKEVYDLVGGIMSWQSAGLNVTTK